VGDARLTARAADRWVRSYALAAGGELQVVNTTGTVEVEGDTGTTVDVVADRIARATTENAARDLLPRITITEQAAPGRVVIQSERLGGIMIGASVEIDYHVKVPAGLVLRVRNTNGTIIVRRLVGRAVLADFNGQIAAEALDGGIEARTVNGGVNVDATTVGRDPIDLRTTNGQIDVSLPAEASGTLLATATNGSIDVNGLRFESMGEQTRRRVRGRLNSGGTPIELATVNGSIHVRARD
jgi:hypothetical protein